MFQFLIIVYINELQLYLKFCEFSRIVKEVPQFVHYLRVKYNKSPIIAKAFDCWPHFGVKKIYEIL